MLAMLVALIARHVPLRLQATKEAKANGAALVTKDDDQKISRAEATGPLKNDFDRLDTNKDGQLSKEELSKAGPPPRG